MTRCWQRCLLWAAVALFTASEVSAKPTVGMVLKSVRNEFFIEMAKGAETYAAAHPDALTLQLEGIQQEVDVTGQEVIIRKMIGQKVDALVVVPTDSVAMLPVLMEAIRAGILVINMDNKLDDRALVLEGVNVPFVGPSNFAGARSVGEYVAKKLPAGSKVGLIEGPPVPSTAGLAVTDSGPPCAQQTWLSPACVAAIGTQLRARAPLSISSRQPRTSRRCSAVMTIWP